MPEKCLPLSAIYALLLTNGAFRYEAKSIVFKLDEGAGVFTRVADVDTVGAASLEHFWYGVSLNVDLFLFCILFTVLCWIAENVIRLHGHAVLRTFALTTYP